MTFYPISLKLEGERVLVVGGGNVARRKTAGLLRAGARVVVVSPALTPEFEPLLADVDWKQRGAVRGDVRPVYRLAVLASDDAALHRELAEVCYRERIPVNIVNDPDGSTFHVPAVLERGSLQVAVSTGGRFPLLSRRIRRDLEARFPDNYDLWLEWLGEYREEIKRTVPAARRREVLNQLVDPRWADAVCRAHREGKAPPRVDMEKLRREAEGGT